MPRKLVDENGEEVEVPTEEELTALKAEADKKVEEAKVQFEKEKTELESQVNPNWKAMREANERLKLAVKSTGKEVDEQGNIVEKPVFNKEEMTKSVEETAKKVYLDGQIATRLGKYDAETSKVVKHYFDKLTAGETVDASNLETYMKQAEQTAGITDHPRSFERGGVPRLETEVSTAAQEMAKDFGVDPKKLQDVSPIIDITK